MAGFWRKCRTTFRWCRISMWLLVLLALCAAFWLNRVGLPDFLKARLVNALRTHHVELEFSRMRLSLASGVVADNVRIGDTDGSHLATLTAREVQLRLDFNALLHRRFQVNGLDIHHGTFTLATAPTNSLTLTNIDSELLFTTNDTWSVNHFLAVFDGIHVMISGELAHAPEVRQWKVFARAAANPAAPSPGQSAANRNALARMIRQVSSSMAQAHLSGSPFLNIFVDGDARDIHSIAIRSELIVPRIETPWFEGRNIQTAARLTAPSNLPEAADPAWGFWTNLQSFELEWTTRAAGLRVNKISVDTLAVGGDWHAPQLAIKHFSARLANGDLDAAATLNIATRQLDFTNSSDFDPHLLVGLLTDKARAQLNSVLWTKPPSLRLAGAIVLPPWTERHTDWREEVAPTVQLHGELTFTNAVANGNALDYFQTQFGYTNQFWDLAGLQLFQGRTRLYFDGTANEVTRDFDGHLRGNLEMASARPFLTASNLVDNFSRLHFTQPLALDVSAHGNWRNWNALGVSGSASLAHFSIDTLPQNQLDIDRLQSHFSYTNQFWNLSGLELAQGRTDLHFDGTSSDATENFVGHLNGVFDPKSVRPFLTAEASAKGLDHVDLKQPLVFQVDANGNWRNLEALTATGHVAMTNFSIRGQAADSVAGTFFYTNRLLAFSHPMLLRAGGAQLMTADTVTMDFKYERIYFTNGFSTADPMYVVQCIGPKTAEILEPYHFPGPPIARVDGCAPMRDVKGGHDLDDADMTFVIVQPTPFWWDKLHSPAMTGTIHWMGQRLALTNIAAQVYGGTGTGYAFFDFTPKHEGADFNFGMTVTNVNLHLLAADLSSSSSNKLAGALSGSLAITNASTETWRSWNGYGHAKLRGGLIWDIPIFGLASDALNLVAPGLGNSRATDASMSFGITNGVIHSDLLEMHTATMRFQYSGTVDLEQNVNARVTAQLLRNAPLVGSLISTVLWPVSKIFECQVTGQLQDPKVTPLWSPVNNMLHPIRSLEGVFTSPESNQ